MAPTNRARGKYEQMYLARQERDLALCSRPGGHPRGLVFDLEAGERVVQFVEGFCEHHKGEWAGRPLLLDEWQKEWIRTAFGWKRADGTRRFRTMLVEIPRKNGKALALDTPIPTPGGWATMGDLKVGDQVFDERGAVCEVVATSEVMVGRPCFRVSFSDGTSVVADADHEWYTEARRNGLPRTGRGQKSSWRARHIRTTTAIRATLHAWPSSGKVEWNHRIPVAEALDLPDRALPIDPYVLGVWLGNGTSAAGAVTEGLPDVEFMRAQFLAAGWPTSERSDPMTLGVPGLMAVLRENQLLNNKHVPAPYLRGSRGQRMALLQGLMDTDGFVAKNGQCEFTTTTPALRDGFMELARSLGFKPQCSTGRAMLRGKDCGEKYRIQFWGFAHDPPFRLPRKAERLKPRPPRRRRSQVRQVVGVDSVPSVPVRCIQVSAPSSLFLAGASMVPTHNSTLAAALGLYLLVADHEPGAEVYASATKEKQARIVWEEAAKTVKRSPKLQRHLKAFRSSIVSERLGSKFEPLGSDSDTQDGLNPHANIVDELHAHRNRGMWDVLATALGSRRQPVTLAITTAGTYDPESIGWELHDHAVKVLEGVYEDDAFFAFIASAERDEEFLNANPGYYFTEAAHREANPGFGGSVKPDYLAQQAQDALRRPSFMNEYLRLHLNIWTQQVTRWLSLEQWAACDPLTPRTNAREFARERENALAGRKCWGGLDLSTKLDLSALVLAFPHETETDVVDLVCRFWLPENTVEAYARKGQKHYEVWAREGWLTTTPGDVIDYAFIRKEIVDLSKIYKLQELGFDPYGATDIATKLGETDGIPMVEVRQGYKTLSEPSKDLEARVVSRRVRHANNPVLRFCVSNAVVTTDPAGNIKPDKAKASGRIDGVVAAIMALSRVIVSEPGSSYLLRGDLVTLG